MLIPSPKEATRAPTIVINRQPYLLTNQLTMGPVSSQQSFSSVTQLTCFLVIFIYLPDPSVTATRMEAIQLVASDPTLKATINSTRKMPRV